MPVKQLSVQTEIMDVTPTLAKRWLESNQGNRNVRQRIVTAYARDMIAGRWQLSGEGVKFSATDRLIDGQHRLHAVVQSGSTVPMLVVRGLADDVQTVLDSGTGRTAGDALRMRDETNYQTLAAGVRVAMQHQDGRIDQSAAKYTHPEIFEWLQRNPDMRTAVETSVSLHRQINMPQSVLTLALWQLSRIDLDGCTRFFMQLAHKTGLSQGDAVLALLNRLNEIAKTGKRVSRSNYLSLVYRAWNHWRAGNSCANLPLQYRGTDIDIPEPK